MARLMVAQRPKHDRVHCRVDTLISTTLRHMYTPHQQQMWMHALAQLPLRESNATALPHYCALFRVSLSSATLTSSRSRSR